MKTDNQADVGQHVFEKSGLGKAPFRVIGMEERRGPITLADGITQVGSPGQPMGTCAHCYTGIALCCTIESSDGKRFIVGSTCVEKTGDAGIIRQFKQLPEVRRYQRELAQARLDKKIQESREIIDAHGPYLATLPHPHDNQAARGKSLLDYATWMLDNAGRSGKADLLKPLKAALALSPVEAADMAARLAAVVIHRDTTKAAKEAAEKAAESTKEAVAQAKREFFSVANKWIIDVLNGNGGSFCADMARRLTGGALSELSPNQLTIVGEIYAKSVGGRCNSKAYNDALDTFYSEAEECEENTQ